ncbi:MAG: hypothetical protein QME07_03570 [bacterium]|nr:hypothetical protein [bacterium]
MKFVMAGLVLLMVGCAQLPGYDRSEYEGHKGMSAVTRITEEKGVDLFCDISKDCQYITFSSNRRGNFDIFIKKPEEQAVIQRTFGQEQDLFPCFAPDGKKIAFSSNRFGSYDIFIIDAFSGQNIRQVTYDETTNEIAPNFSPDGRFLVFSKISRDKKMGAEIVMADLEKGLFTYITHGLFPKFSPDGKKICFQRDIGKGKQSIWTIEVNGTRETEVVYNETLSAMMPVWSSDGERLCYVAFKGSEIEAEPERSLIEGLLGLPADIRMVNIDGTYDTQITSGGTNLYPCWSSDGVIYFSTLRGDNIDIYRTEIGKKEEVKKVEEAVPPHKIVPKPDEEKRKTFFFPKQTEEGITVKATKDNVNIWSYPGKTVIAKVNKGDGLVVIDASEKWYYQVKLPNGMSGWICSFFVEK